MVEQITEGRKNVCRIDKRYSVLSLDGGGVRGLMTTMILAEIETQIATKIGRSFKITDAFDCVIGTSAGGLIALALSVGYSACELRDSVMEEMIPATFSNQRGKIAKWFKPAYDESNLEAQFRKHIHTKLGFKASDNPTFADLVKKNPRLRTCITAVNYEFDEKNGGPSFTPRIFDTQNPQDQDKTLLGIGRATSAAPTYFKPSTIAEKKDDGTEVNQDFVDGGVFANNPAGWGFALAAVNIKAENIRVVSVGTGFRDYSLDKKPEVDEFPSFWDKTKNYFGGWKDYMLEVAQVKDTAGQKSGMASWLSAEIVGKSIFDIQKQSEQVLHLYAGVMQNNYYRLNPGLTQEIRLDRADKDDRALMRREVANYLSTEQAKIDLAKVIDNILTPDNYYQKALVSLMKAAQILEYCKYINQEPSHGQSKQSAAVLKLLGTHFQNIVISEEDVHNEDKGIKADLDYLSKLFKSDAEYPTIKSNMREYEGHHHHHDESDETQANSNHATADTQ